MKTFNLEPVLGFLTELSTHNNKAWFDQNRETYENAKAEFERFVNALIDEFRGPDGLEDLTAKDCISRIYRDIRFSKDKTPYHTHMWASIAPGGKRMTRMGYHVAIHPGGHSMLAGGMYEPSPEQLARYRQSIDEDASEFKKVMNNKALLDYFGGIGGDRVKTVPQGFDRSNPEIELLKYKQVVVMRQFSDQQVLASDFFDLVVNGCQVMRPFLNYFDRLWSD